MAGTRKDVEFRIMPSGDGRWYWRSSARKNVIARGIADDELNACTAASDAARQADLIE
jgi:hypothetical protein